MPAQSEKTVRVIDSTAGCPKIPIIVGRGNAKVLMWPGNNAQFRTFQIFTLECGDRTLSLDHDGDAVYYVMSGAGSIVDGKSGLMSPLVAGAMIHIDAGDVYQFRADRDGGLQLLGGPCPADQRLYAGLTYSEEV